jgi:hypothetical protein
VSVVERALSARGRQFSSRRGRLDLFSAGPLLLVRLADHGEADFVAPIQTAFDVIVARGERPEVFFDAGRLVNYDSDLRTRLTSHFAKHRSQIASLHIFVRSRLVAMGVSVAKLVLGQLITVHTELPRFCEALDEVARRTRAVGISSTLLSDS